MDVLEQAKQLHADFVAAHGHTPKYVDVVVIWQGWEPLCHETLKIKDFDIENTENDPDDEEITFYVEGIDGLCDLIQDHVEDFEIVEVCEFSDYMIW